MRRRIVFMALFIVGILVLAMGSLQGGWSRIYYFSTQICLSCMGLV